MLQLSPTPSTSQGIGDGMLTCVNRYRDGKVRNILKNGFFVPEFNSCKDVGLCISK